MPRVTIAVPCFNEKRFIRDTLLSLAAQSENDIEIIVCDNCSTDGTAEIAREIAESDSRIRIDQSSENIGGRLNFIRAFEKGTSPYFMWAGAHDLYSSQFVENLCNKLDENNRAVLCFCDSVFIEQNGVQRDDEPVFPAMELYDSSETFRYTRMIWNLSRCDMLHGVMRREMVDISPMLRAPEAPDMAFLPGLALKGLILRDDKAMFFRRKSRGKESSEEHLEHLVEDGYLDASTPRIQIWETVRDSLLSSIADENFGLSEQKELEMFTRFCFQKRFGVSWEIEKAANFYEKIQLRTCRSSDKKRNRILKRIERKIVAKTLASGVSGSVADVRLRRRYEKLKGFEEGEKA